MVAAAIIGSRMNITDPVLAARIISLVRSYGEIPVVAVSAKRVLKLLQSDKKTMGGVPHFILATSKLGAVQVVNTVPSSAVVAAVEEITELSQSQ
jgi:3-dehydroquinate synthetase